MNSAQTVNLLGTTCGEWTVINQSQFNTKIKLVLHIKCSCGFVKCMRYRIWKKEDSKRCNNCRLLITKGNLAIQENKQDMQKQFAHVRHLLSGRNAKKKG